MKNTATDFSMWLTYSSCKVFNSLKNVAFFFFATKTWFYAKLNGKYFATRRILQLTRATDILGSKLFLAWFICCTSKNRQNFRSDILTPTAKKLFQEFFTKDCVALQRESTTTDWGWQFLVKGIRERTSFDYLSKQITLIIRKLILQNKKWSKHENQKMLLSRRNMK